MMILCYRCGTAIEPSESNLCQRCLNNTVDLSSKVKRFVSIEKCRGCERYHSPPSLWKTLAWGSKDLLVFLLARNKTLRKMNIIDSNFIYTEEHSNKVKIEILILENAVEQPVIIDYSIRNKQCSRCMRIEAKQYWRVMVQLRQKPHHRRTFMYLERLMLQHRAHLSTSNIAERKDGLDFYYQDNSAALKMVDFLRSFFGVHVLVSEQLISLDTKNNTANKKITYSLKMVPFCVDDLVLSSDRSTGLSDVLLVKRAKNCVEFLDPLTQKTARITAKKYFAEENKYKILLRSDSLKEYNVVCARKAKDGVYEATVAEQNGKLHDISSYIPLKDDEIVYGYDIENLNLSEEVVNFRMPVLLVRKNCTDFDEFGVEDREMRYLLADVSSDKGMLVQILGSLPKNPLVEEFSRTNFC